MRGSIISIVALVAALLAGVAWALSMRGISWQPSARGWSAGFHKGSFVVWREFCVEGVGLAMIPYIPPRETRKNILFTIERDCGDIDMEGDSYTIHLRDTFNLSMLWLMGLFLLVAALMLAYRQKGRHQNLSVHCLTCGYSLTGNTSGVCPECGTAVKPALDATMR